MHTYTHAQNNPKKEKAMNLKEQKKACGRVWKGERQGRVMSLYYSFKNEIST